MSDLSLLVARLARNQMLLVHPSPLGRIGTPDIGISSTGSPSSVPAVSSAAVTGYTGSLLTQIHRHVVSSCIADTFPELLYAYLDYWRYLWCYLLD